MNRYLSAMARAITVAGILGLIAEGVSAQTIIDAPPTAYPNQGAVEYFSGNVVLNVRDGAQIFRPISAINGATINLLGGELTQGVSAGDQGRLNINDGLLAGLTGELFLNPGSHTTIRGGRLMRPILKQIGAELVIEGFDFELGGVPVPGLDAAGDEASVVVPFDTVFAGVYASGAAFTFYGEQTGGDSLYGNVTLRRVERPSAPAVIELPNVPEPPGILPGQTVILNSSGSLPNGTNAPRGSTVQVQGGTLGVFEAYHSLVDVGAGNGGSITAYEGAKVHITGGSTARVSARRGSQFLMEGGALNRINAYADSNVELRGGDVSFAQVLFGAEMLMSGGQIVNNLTLGEYDSTFRLTGGQILPDIRIPQGSHLIIEGGSVKSSDDFAVISALHQSELTVVGRSFKLDGANIAGLAHPGDSVLLTQREGQTLDVVLRDGSPLKLFVDDAFFPQQPQRTYIHPKATLRVTLVPEPTNILFAPFAAAAFVHAIPARRCRRRPLAA